MTICDVCGFKSKHGVVFALLGKKVFNCRRCFMNLSLFAPCKLIAGFHIVNLGRGKRFHYQKRLNPNL